MDEVTGFDSEAIHLDDEIMFDEWVRECIARERVEQRNQDQIRMLSRDDGWQLPSPLTEGAFRLSLESLGEE